MPYADRDQYLAAQKSYYHKDKESYKWRNIKNNYGITKDQFFDMLEDQENRCKLCKDTFRSLNKNDLHIDHCHETHKIRGLLCMKCNVGLGMLGDTKNSISNALLYVKGELV